MSEAPAFFVVALVAVMFAFWWDVATGEFMPSPAGLMIGLILGTMALG